MAKKTYKKDREYKRLIIGLCFLFVFGGGFILYLSWPLLTGTTIVIDTMPVDPFDPFRGQYIIINYEISRVDSVEGAEQGDKVYVSLAPDEEDVWRLEKVSLTKPEIGVFMKGNVKSISGNNMRIEYGIEQFFFERNAQLPTRNMTVEVKVDSSGRARINQLLYNGEPVVIDYKEVSISS
ncbi:GDYXXLXY domain-containing protein [candidate division KSB1 bacterium]